MAFGAQEYRRQQATGASRIHLVVMAYDAAIVACERRDAHRASEVVTALRNSLDLTQDEPAAGLYRLYQWCLGCISNKDYDGALAVLRSLRDAWATVEKRQNAPLASQAAGAASFVSAAL